MDIPDSLPDGPQAVIPGGGVQVVASGAPQTDWNDPSATQNLDPPDLQAGTRTDLGLG